MSVARIILMAGAVQRTRWDENEKSAAITLSDGDLLAEFAGGGGAFVGVRGTNSRAAGKLYAEFAITNGAASNPPMGVGLAEDAHSPSTQLGSDATSCAAWLGTDQILLGGSAIGTLNNSSDGDTICMAVDLDNARIWFRVNNGNWNNSGTANPATNAGGADISSLTEGLYPAASFSPSAGGSVTANFGASAFAFTKPSGFVSWY